MPDCSGMQFCSGNQKLSILDILSTRCAVDLVLNFRPLKMPGTDLRHEVAKVIRADSRAALLGPSQLLTAPLTRMRPGPIRVTS